jgi:hypothetical protein
MCRLRRVKQNTSLLNIFVSESLQNKTASWFCSPSVMVRASLQFRNHQNLPCNGTLDILSEGLIVRIIERLKIYWALLHCTALRLHNLLQFPPTLHSFHTLSGKSLAYFPWFKSSNESRVTTFWVFFALKPQRDTQTVPAGRNLWSMVFRWAQVPWYMYQVSWILVQAFKS